MPIHLRAEPGDYADAVLLPGDPLRAKYIADTYLDGVEQVNGERGLLGFTGTYEGKPGGVRAGCLLTVSDIIVEGVFTRITDEELRAAVDRMTRVALATVTSDH